MVVIKQLCLTRVVSSNVLANIAVVVITLILFIWLQIVSQNLSFKFQSCQLKRTFLLLFLTIFKAGISNRQNIEIEKLSLNSISSSPCISSPCLNSGVCITIIDDKGLQRGYKCKCTNPQDSGMYCEDRNHVTFINKFKGD